jgi:ribosome-associated protein
MGHRDLIVRRNLVIPGAELRESASRAGGPGGQHVNKTSTRVTLRWSVAESEALTDSQRRRLRERLDARLTRAGELVVHASARRSRARNREQARERLASLVRDGLRVQRARVATKPGAGARKRRLDAKQRRSALKQGRSRPRSDED